MPEWAMNLLETTGTSGVLLLIFYFYHKSSTDQMKDIISNLNKVIDKNFDLLKTMIEQNTMQLSFLQRIDENVKNNVWCPIVQQAIGKEKPGKEKYND